MDTIFENGQEYIVIDGTKMPVYQMRPRRKPSGCANCDWNSMTDEEKQAVADELSKITEILDKKR